MPVSGAATTYDLCEHDRDGRRLLSLRIGDETWLLCGNPRRQASVVAVPRDLPGGGLPLASGTALLEPTPESRHSTIRFADGGLDGNWKLTEMPGAVWLLHDAADDAGPLAVSAGGVVLRGEGRRCEVLLVRPRGRRSWTLPKGTLESGETIREGALREVLEETGQRAEIQTELDPVEYRFPGTREGERRTIHKVVHWFRMRPSGEPEPYSATVEIEDVRWFAIDAAWPAIHLGALRGVLKQALRADARQERP